MKCERHFTGIVFSPAEQDDNFLSEQARPPSRATQARRAGLLGQKVCVGLCVSMANSFSCNLFSALSHRGVGPMPYGPEAAISAENFSFQP
jgi:hypothetical protein